MATISLDGHCEDRTGRFDWTAPDDWTAPADAVLAFVGGIARSVGTFLFGRRKRPARSGPAARGQSPTQPPTSPLAQACCKVPASR